MDLVRIFCLHCVEPLMIRPDTTQVLACPYCKKLLIVGHTEGALAQTAFAVDATATFWKAVVLMPDTEPCCFIVKAKSTSAACKIVTAAVNSPDWVLDSIVKIQPEEAAHHLADCEHAMPLNFGPQFAS